MSRFRSLLFWSHLVTALALGLVVVTLAATGLLLAFEEPLQTWADRNDRRLATPRGEISVAGTLAALAAARPEITASAVTLRRDEGEALAVGLGRAGTLYVDPASGAVRGPGSESVRAFFRGVESVHRFLGARGESQAAGKAVTGAANLAFLFLLLSGLYLWIPRLLRWSAFRQLLFFRRGLSPKAREFNWHHVAGIWAALPLALVVVSAVPMSYRWANALVVGESPRSEAPRPATSAPGTTAPSSPASARPSGPPALASIDLAGLDAALAAAAKEVPAWRALSVRFPPRDGTWSVSADASASRGRPDLRTQVNFDVATRSVTAVERFADQRAGRRARSWMRWIHTGEAGGTPGRFVGALACAATLLLGWSGYALTLRRFAAWRARRRRPAGPPATNPTENDLSRAELVED